MTTGLPQVFLPGSRPGGSDTDAAETKLLIFNRAVEGMAVTCSLKDIQVREFENIAGVRKSVVNQGQDEHHDPEPLGIHAEQSEEDQAVLQTIIDR